MVVAFPGAVREMPAPRAAVFLPKEKPMAKKNAQTNTKAKKIPSMRPVPSVISVSCCAVGIVTSFRLYFPAGAAGAGMFASNFWMPE